MARVQDGCLLDEQGPSENRSTLDHVEGTLSADRRAATRTSNL
jgi:hypothetical protein